MNDCKIVQDILPIYLDGETSPETSQFVEEHLVKCDECREQFLNCNRVPHAMDNSGTTKGIYKYSEVTRKIYRYRMIQTATVAAFSAAIGCMAGYLLKEIKNDENHDN